jgi:hypothetical protein
MDNQGKLATLGTQDTEWRQTKQMKTQPRKLKRWATRNPPKMKPGAHDGQTVPTSYNITDQFLPLIT